MVKAEAGTTEARQLEGPGGQAIRVERKGYISAQSLSGRHSPNPNFHLAHRTQPECHTLLCDLKQVLNLSEPAVKEALVTPLASQQRH